MALRHRCRWDNSINAAQFSVDEIDPPADAGDPHAAAARTRNGANPFDAGLFQSIARRKNGKFAPSGWQSQDSDAPLGQPEASFAVFNHRLAKPKTLRASAGNRGCLAVRDPGEPGCSREPTRSHSIAMVREYHGVGQANVPFGS